MQNIVEMVVASSAIRARNKLNQASAMYLSVHEECDLSFMTQLLVMEDDTKWRM
jgi:hypothetical protein